MADLKSMVGFLVTTNPDAARPLLHRSPRLPPHLRRRPRPRLRYPRRPCCASARRSSSRPLTAPSSVGRSTTSRPPSPISTQKAPSSSASPACPPTKTPSSPSPTETRSPGSRIPKEISCRSPSTSSQTQHTQTERRVERQLRAALQVDRPAQLRQPLFNVDQRSRQCRPPVRARGSLRQDAFALQLQCLPLALALRLLGRAWWRGVSSLAAAAACCSSTDLLSQPLDMQAFYAHPTILSRSMLR